MPARAGKAQHAARQAATSGRRTRRGGGDWRNNVKPDMERDTFVVISPKLYGRNQNIDIDCAFMRVKMALNTFRYS
jgi:hypothetical protein